MQNEEVAAYTHLSVELSHLAAYGVHVPAVSAVLAEDVFDER
jgi:hypothetical protein